MVDLKSRNYLIFHLPKNKLYSFVKSYFHFLDKHHSKKYLILNSYIHNSSRRDCGECGKTPGSIKRFPHLDRPRSFSKHLWISQNEQTGEKRIRNLSKRNVGNLWAAYNKFTFV